MSDELKTDRTDGREMLRELLTRLRIEAQRRIKRSPKRSGARARVRARGRDGVGAHDCGGRNSRRTDRAREKEVRYLDEAFARLDAGTYGRCLKCGGAIPIERLMAIPFASYCVDCQQSLHRDRGGWGEGTTIAPFDQQWTLPEEMETPTEREYRATDPEEQLTINSRGTLASAGPDNQAKRQPSRNKQTPRRKR